MGNDNFELIATSRSNNDFTVDGANYSLKETSATAIEISLSPDTDGLVEKIKGFIMAAGHEGDGIALSAITGKLISELIINGEPTVSLENFNLNRFSTELI